MLTLCGVYTGRNLVRFQSVTPPLLDQSRRIADGYPSEVRSRSSDATLQTKELRKGPRSSPCIRAPPNAFITTALLTHFGELKDKLLGRKRGNSHTLLSRSKPTRRFRSGQVPGQMVLYEGLFDRSRLDVDRPLFVIRPKYIQTPHIRPLVRLLSRPGNRQGYLLERRGCFGRAQCENGLEERCAK